MYRLFQRITKGLDPVAEIFKKHVEAEGMKLVKEVTEAIQSKKEKDAGEIFFALTLLISGFLVWQEFCTDAAKCDSVFMTECKFTEELEVWQAEESHKSHTISIGNQKF